ncbi:MAG TPA: hypothetical protein DDZ55_00880 [Firmicutes bacterium]|nr:hypothetical protein [Bacillota bacterium]
MLRDKLLFGAFAGVFAGLVMDLPEYILWELNILNHPLSHYAASLFVEHSVLHSNKLGLVLALVVSVVYSAFLGIIFIYLLNLMNKRFVLAKGLLYGAFIWLFSYGILSSLPLVKLSVYSKTPLEILLFFLLHLLYGFCLGLFTRKFGSKLEIVDVQGN